LQAKFSKRRVLLDLTLKLNNMKIKLNKGLKLSTESLSKLQESQMAKVKGGLIVERGTSGPRCTCRRNSCQGNDVTTTAN
jgi:hypothetical protein